PLVNLVLAVAAQPLDGVLVLGFHPHGGGGGRGDATVVEAARDGRVVPPTNAAPHLDRVVGLVKPHPGDSDPVIEQGTGGPERALAPSLLQRFVAADQYDATWHRRLSSFEGDAGARVYTPQGPCRGLQESRPPHAGAGDDPR